MTFSKNENVNYFGLFYIFGSFIQFTFSCAALGVPDFFTGNFKLQTVVDFANSINTLSINASSLDTYVDARIGIFQTIINGVVFNENREGFKAMLGFLIMAVMHSFEGVITSIPILYPHWRRLLCPTKCYNDFQTSPVKLLGKSAKVHAQKNFSSGLSSAVVLFLFYFTAAEKFGPSDFGFSYYILLVADVFSFLQAIIAWQHANHCKNIYTKEKNKKTNQSMKM